MPITKMAIFVTFVKTERMLVEGGQELGSSFTSGVSVVLSGPQGEPVELPFPYFPHGPL